MSCPAHPQLGLDPGPGLPTLTSPRTAQVWSGSGWHQKNQEEVPEPEQTSPSCTPALLRRDTLEAQAAKEGAVRLVHSSPHPTVLSGQQAALAWKLPAALCSWRQPRTSVDTLSQPQCVQSAGFTGFGHGFHSLARLGQGQQVSG